AAPIRAVARIAAFATVERRSLRRQRAARGPPARRRVRRRVDRAVSERRPPAPAGGGTRPRMTAPASYVRRPVAVVGGFGFIGWNLVDRLVGLGARVTVVTRALDRHRAAAAAIEARGVAVREGDLRDAAAMREAVLGQEIVFNLAGQSGAADSMRDPWTDLDVNCRGNLVLLEALRQRAAQAKLVFVSSRLAYGRVGPLPAREDRAPDPLCIHAVHKLAVEQYLAVYGHA